MNLLIPKFNVTTNTQRLINNITKHVLYLLFLFCLMLNYNTTSAQTGDCSERNPIEWNWIRSFIYYEQLHRCSVGEIRQFEYNGSIYIETVPPETVTGQFCSTNYAPRYFDCNGELLCDLSDTDSLCDTELLNAANNYTTLWTYKDCGADPLEWDWIQDLIDSSDGSNVSAIHQFEHEGNSYIKTINSNNSIGDYNVYFGCEGEQVCQYIFESNTTDCDNSSIHYSSNGNFTIVWSFEDPYPTATCPDGDPLQWNWIQDIILESDVCTSGFLSQFEYNGNPYFYFGEGTYCNIADLPQYYFNCVGDTVCSLGMAGGSCDNNFRNSTLNSTTIWTYEPPLAKTCPEGYPEQWDWVKTMRDNISGCGETEIVDIVFDDFTIIYFWNECDNSKNRFYDCHGNLLCGVESDLRLGWLCYQLSNVMEGYTPAVCPEGNNPLQWDWMRDLIIEYSDCEVHEIRQFEYREKTYFKTISRLDFPCDDYGIGYFDCAGRFICDDLFGPSCTPEIVAASDTYETIWQYRNGIPAEACPEGDPLDWQWIQDLIAIEGRCDVGGSIQQFEYEGNIYFRAEPGEFDERGFYCPEDYPSRIYDCNGQLLCEFGDMVRPDECLNTILNTENPFAGNTVMTTIWSSQLGVLLNIIECPQDYITTLCVPVAASPPLTLPDLITTGNLSYLNSMSMQMEEQTNTYKYYNTTTRVYTITNETGNQKTCATKHHIAHQLLEVPEVSQSGVVCEEDLWSYVKMGTDQYKIYADNNGSKGAELSTCNTPSLICSTADLGVDTKVPGQYNFWATTFFEFPDGSICESDPTLFYADVQPKPVAELTVQNKTVNIGEGITLMDLVADNKNGFWTGENITYLITVTGQNIAYFSTNNPGVYKLYYTVSNEFCERSYLMVVEVNGSAGKSEIIAGINSPHLPSFNIYPNPTSGKVFIDLSGHSMQQINLMDISGKVMRQINKGLKKVEINVDDIPKGIYLVEVKNETGSLVQKLILE